MAYNGYLLKIGGNIIPNSLIRAETYKVTVNTSDNNSFADADGVLHRNVSKHTSKKVEWNMPVCDNAKMQKFLTILRSIWGENPERKATCEIYVPEWDRYVAGTYYMPDFTLSMRRATSDDIQYAETRFALIEY